MCSTSLPLPCSTLIEEISGSSLSRGMARRVWPFDLAHGAKTNCG